VLSGEAANTNFIVFGLTRLWPELTKNLLHRHRDFGQSYDDCSRTCGLWLKKIYIFGCKLNVMFSTLSKSCLLLFEVSVNTYCTTQTWTVQQNFSKFCMGSQSQIFLLLHPTIILVTNINLCFIYFWVQFCFVSFTFKISFLPPLPFVSPIPSFFQQWRWNGYYVYIPMHRLNSLEHPMLIDGTYSGFPMSLWMDGLMNRYT
jgi:hypothetical protein